ncbi:MAG TPA: GNAT family N-acetyltransferase [Candidatus Limnocylindria bacterium]|nr:GNAT family N-acetyltransferase [Candidatus Limnocylindria bacterium]
MAAPQPQTELIIRPLAEGDLAAADRIVRLAFGTFLGMPDPIQFMGDADFARTRWKADPSAVLGAEQNGKLIGSNFVTNWGSFGFFGPLTIHPDYWNRGIAQRLLGPTMDIFERWGVRHRGLFTFAGSPKHVALYQRYGFWPRDLVATVEKEVRGVTQLSAPSPDVSLLSESKPDDQNQIFAAARRLTAAIFEGLDVSREIRAVADQCLGETVLVWDGPNLAAFAVCHLGAGSEAGSGVCYAKFAAVRPGLHAQANFLRLLNGIEYLAAHRGAFKITAGVNLARRQVFQSLFTCGYRTQMQGLAMETGDASSGYNRADVYILDDWR